MKTTKTTPLKPNTIIRAVTKAMKTMVTREAMTVRDLIVEQKIRNVLELSGSLSFPQCREIAKSHGITIKTRADLATKLIAKYRGEGIL